MEITYECPVCGSSNLKFQIAGMSPFVRQRMFNNDISSSCMILACEDCEFLFFNVRPTEEEMARYYSNYRDEKYQQDRQKFDAWYTKEFNDALETEDIIPRNKITYEYLKSYIENPSVVVDYGGDRGQYIPEELNSKVNYVFDISQVDLVPNRIQVSSLEELMNIEQIDLVMCAHVLEHVSYPKEIITNLTKLNRENTLYYIELPYDLEFILKMNGTPFYEHINFFNETSLATLLHNFNFNILNITTSYLDTTNPSHILQCVANLNS